MASPQDYRKPRNKELQDLVWNLPQPLRVRDADGRILWQNKLAEQVPSETGWSASSIAWQSKKATLETPEPVSLSPDRTRVEELEEEVSRLKKQQRQTARKKRQAEESARKQERSVEDVEKRLRRQIEELEKKLGKLPSQLEKLQAENKKLKDLSKTLRAKEEHDARLELVNKELRRAKEESARRLEDVEFAKRESAEQAQALFEARRRLAELEAELEEATRPGVIEEGLLGEERARCRLLQEENQKLEGSLVELARERDDARRRADQALADLTDLELVFQDFKQGVEKAASDREAESRLAERIAELESLESTFEREQQSFEEEKQELLARIDSQERETRALKEGMLEKKAVQEDGVLDELREELEDLKTELDLARRREKRSIEKLSTMETLREEQAKVLDLLKEDLAESRQRERELKERLNDRSPASVGEDESSREEMEKLRRQVESLGRIEAELREKVSQLESQVSTGSAEDSLSVPVKSQLDFLKKRLTSTEKELDETRMRLQQEKAQNQSSKESERLAFQDGLTGLPNRNMIDRYLDYAHQRAKLGGRAVGLFLIDVSGFRILNRTNGMKWGDKLLQAVGQRLNSMRGASHMVGRLAQDRFVLLAAELERANQAQFLQDASRSLLEALAYPFEIDGEEVRLTGSVGVSFGPLEGDSSRGLYDQAEEALSFAKKLGTSKFALYDDNVRHALQKEQTYSMQMAHAIEKDEFKAVFQPVFNLTKGIVLGLELLLRWEHRDRRTLEPREFLEPALKSGLIFRITERVWPKAFKDFSRWRKMRPGLTLSINLSDRELLNPKVLRLAVSLATEHQIDPKSIIFEVRDQSRLRISSTWWRILQDYTSAGFGLCLDDFASDSTLFGTLAYSGFVQAKMSAGDEKGIRFVAAPNASKNLLYGVKHLQQKFDKKALAKAGFHLAQGFAVSRPLDAPDVDMVLS